MYIARWSTTEPNEISSDIHNRRTLHRQAKQTEQKSWCSNTEEKNIITETERPGTLTYVIKTNKEQVFSRHL